mmetsp:Transcript_42705/g.68549  ORF Transcript_42705/g.68549 Transcript_42705/m.68549 type:complete len:242 (-) Transcript_42705:401-1126(-)
MSDNIRIRRVEIVSMRPSSRRDIKLFSVENIQQIRIQRHQIPKFRGSKTKTSRKKRHSHRFGRVLGKAAVGVSDHEIRSAFIHTAANMIRVFIAFLGSLLEVLGSPRIMRQHCVPVIRLNAEPHLNGIVIPVVAEQCMRINHADKVGLFGAQQLHRHIPAIHRALGAECYVGPIDGDVLAHHAQSCDVTQVARSAVDDLTVLAVLADRATLIQHGQTVGVRWLVLLVDAYVDILRVSRFLK